ncbi:MAG: HAMP domain-containing sensor histidine kinase [Terrimesophilobacter sp.]
MKATKQATRIVDADADAIRRASRIVGTQLTIASSVLVVVVLSVVFALVFRHLSFGRIFSTNHTKEATVDVGGLDIIFGGVLIGVVAIVLAGGLSVLATRRAVRPLGEALRLQRAFVSDASHELRTPLAVLDSRLQLLQRGLPPGDTAAPIVAELRGDAKALIGIVNDLLASAEIDAKPNDTPVEVNQTVTLAVSSLHELAADRDVTIVIADTVPLFTMVPAASLHRCVIALLDNALDYAPAGSTITVSLSVRKQLVRLAVRDEGPGIRGIDIDRVFDRFARSSTDVDDEGALRAGYGIGLSLVRDTVERVGGRASVSSSSANGTEIELLIPLAR